MNVEVYVFEPFLVVIVPKDNWRRFWLYNTSHGKKKTVSGLSTSLVHTEFTDPNLVLLDEGPQRQWFYIRSV